LEPATATAAAALYFRKERRLNSKDMIVPPLCRNTEIIVLPPSGYIELICCVPTGWQKLNVTFVPTFVANKSLTFKSLYCPEGRLAYTIGEK